MDERGTREAALELAQQFVKEADPKPLRSVHKIAPVVYKLMKQGVTVETILLVLHQAKVHTPDGIAFTLAHLKREPKHPQYRDYTDTRIRPYSDEEREAGLAAIKRTREMLTGRRRYSDNGDSGAT